MLIVIIVSVDGTIDSIYYRASMDSGFGASIGCRQCFWHSAPLPALIGTLHPSQHSVAFCIQYRPEFSKDFSKNRKNAYNYMGYAQIPSKSLKLRVDTYK